jgi:CubicO group peptidase (beta-lactamase class C family)
MKDFRFFLLVILWGLTLAINSCAQPPKANDPIPDGYLPADIKTVDSLVGSFMEKYKVPGLSFTIAQQDSVKIERCYGYADKNKNQLMNPGSLFRIASISKPITATAIMQLMEQGRLHLTDKVFGKGAILGTAYGTYPYKKWVDEISIEILLEHLAGGWGNNDDQDPMFLHPEMNQTQLISWTLDNQPLLHEPGTHFQYSNFGFCLLGRVIEKVTGITYEDYVRKNILEPCGITDMQIGGNTLAERLPREVYYYDKQEDPYSMNVRRMDSHGGWIATPADLVKFVIRVDKFPQKSDILAPATLDTMFSAPAVNPGYAKGWAVNKYDNYFHNGSLPGQQSILVRAHDGFCWAVMVNTRMEGNFSLDLDQLMWHIRKAISRWPDVEL